MNNLCIILFIQLAFGGAFAAVKNCDKVKCPSIPKHYEEMGCEAVKADDDCCPIR